MKNLVKFIGIIVLTMVIVFPIVARGSTDRTGTARTDTDNVYADGAIDDENNPIALAKRVFDLIMQLEGRDDKDPAVVEELRMLGKIVEKFSKSDQKIYNEELERLYIGE